MFVLRNVLLILCEYNKAGKILLLTISVYRTSFLQMELPRVELGHQKDNGGKLRRVL